RIGLLHRPRAPAAMRILPRPFERVDVVLDVLDVLAALEQQDVEPFLRQLLRGPAAGYAGADDDRVVFVRLRRHYARATANESIKLRCGRMTSPRSEIPVSLHCSGICCLTRIFRAVNTRGRGGPCRGRRNTSTSCRRRSPGA